MKTKLKLFVFVLGTISVMMSCNSTQIVSDYNSDYDFNNIKTYALEFTIQDNDGAVDINDLNKNRIERYIHNELQTRGLQVTQENPDVMIKYYAHVDIERSISTNGSLTGSGYGRYGYRGGHASGSRQATLETTTIGFLTIEMKDNTNEKLVWYSTGNKSINTDNIGKNADKKVSDTIHKMMDKFPVQN